jgi:4-amino-4-deoxy-L-arabinose transferase-like glycosyltransferase
MLVLLPLLAFALLIGVFRRKGFDWRAAFLYASIPWSVFLALVTELLTQFRCLTLLGVVLCWAAFVCVCFLWMRKQGKTLPAAGISIPAGSSGRWEARAAQISIAAFVLLTALTALASAPNNWDAMQYHLPRVVEWILNRGVQFYPTPDWAQLDQPPFAEYIMLHLDLLSGSDRLLALVQWFAYIGSIVAASLIARELGGGRRTQLFAALLATTIPSAVLGASSTKNDCVGGYWMVLSVYLLLCWSKRHQWLDALAIGSTLGLAVFTKGTAYMFLPCLVLACGILWERKEQWLFVSRLPAIVAVIVLLCGPLWVRNIQFAGSPLGLPYFYGIGNPKDMTYANAKVTPRLAAANVIRNIGLHVGVPSDRINAFSTRVFSRAIEVLGVDPNDPRQMFASASEPGVRHFKIRFFPKGETLAGDPVPLLLFLLAGAIVLVYPRKVGWPVILLCLGIVGAFILYCALLRWSPWSARYQIPLFVLGSACIAIVFTRTLPRWAILTAAALSVLLAIPCALGNDARPLLRKQHPRSILFMTRDQTYFLDFHPQLADSFIAAAAAARATDCRSIGLDADLLHFEYPMMALVNQDSTYRHIRYTGVENSSVRYSQPHQPPLCMVICLGCLNHPEKTALYSPELPQIQSFGSIVLFLSSRRKP